MAFSLFMTGKRGACARILLPKGKKQYGREKRIEILT